MSFYARGDADVFSADRVENDPADPVCGVGDCQREHRLAHRGEFFRIRKQITDLGYIVEETRQGTVIRKA